MTNTGVRGFEDPIAARAQWTPLVPNLVLTSGERVNLVDHGDLDRVRADAKKISDLLGCKLWDAGS